MVQREHDAVGAGVAKRVVERGTEIEHDGGDAKHGTTDDMACVACSGGAHGQQDQSADGQNRAKAMGDAIGNLFADALVCRLHVHSYPTQSYRRWWRAFLRAGDDDKKITFGEGVAGNIESRSIRRTGPA